MNKSTIRNLFISFGIYWFSMWVATPIAWIFAKATSGIIYHGLSGQLLMNVISAIPIALVSFFAGFTLTHILDKPTNKYFVILLCTLYAVTRFFAVHFHIAPGPSDYVFLFVCSIIPAVSCYAGGVLAGRNDQNED
jgi:hypothetical protein